MTAVVANRPEDYRRLGLNPDAVEAWEDGLRTGGADGTFEWWYIDCHRLLGDVTLKCSSGAHVDELRGTTMWELLYFGALSGNARPHEQSEGPALIPHQA